MILQHTVIFFDLFFSPPHSFESVSLLALVDVVAAITAAAISLGSCTCSGCDTRRFLACKEWLEGFLQIAAEMVLLLSCITGCVFIRRDCADRSNSLI